MLHLFALYLHLYVVGYDAVKDVMSNIIYGIASLGILGLILACDHSFSKLSARRRRVAAQQQYSSITRL